MAPEEFGGTLRKLGLDLVSVAIHRHTPDVLIVYLTGTESQQASEVAVMTVADVPGVVAVTASVGSRSILLVQVEPTVCSGGAGEVR